MEIRKIKNDYGRYNIEVENDSKLLSIYQGGDDPNFMCRYSNFKGVKEGVFHISFDISCEYQELYEIFSKLFTRIIKADILGDEQIIKTIKSSSIYEELVQDDIVVFKSDDYPTDCPNILRIIKNDNSITLDFEKIDGKPFCVSKVPYGIHICIRQSGCRYDPFNIPFNIMFRELQNIQEIRDNTCGRVLKK